MIVFRLRCPLRFYDRDMVLLWHLDGRGLPPPKFTIPARTTLTLLDLPGEYGLCATPDGKTIRVSFDTLREHAYIPRRKR
jgi:hypothetical protein